MKKNILDMSLMQLSTEVISFGIEKYRVNQIFDWIYKKNILSFEKMTNLPHTILDKLNQYFSTSIPMISHISKSQKDSSIKFLLKSEDSKYFESILMPSGNKATICVSCMIGCPLKCRFCATGSEIGFVRNLKPSEILGQIFSIQKYIQETSLDLKITNIVFMGMGEPFLNLKAMETSIDTLISKNGFGKSKARITISTAGVNTNIAKFINKFGVKLAVSLHFPNDELRSKFMPINKSFSLKPLIDELKKIKLGKREFITIEYIMIDGTNDRIEHAKQLTKLFSTLKVKFNLIPYNPTKTFDVKSSSDNQINNFASLLRSKGFVVTVRRSKGSDIDGGCGQFALKRI